MKRSSAVAGLLAAVGPGLGHAYAARPLRGVVWLVLPLLGVLAAGLGPFADAGSAIAACLVVLGVSYLGSIVDAVVVARSGGDAKASGVMIATVAGIGLLGVPTTCATFARSLLIEAFKVPSGSMVPSILVGEHFFADKVVYRRRDPRRGEVMVFFHPEHNHQAFVTRVIGLPDDTIEARGGRPIINGWDVPRCLVGMFHYDDAMESAPHEGELWIEFLEDAAFFVFTDKSAPSPDYQGPYHPDGFFVMGDNRNNAHDSRLWYGGEGGSVPRSLVRGQARWTFAPRYREIAAPPLAPTPDLAPAVAKCLANRPPREKTTPPPPKK